MTEKWTLRLNFYALSYSCKMLLLPLTVMTFLSLLHTFVECSFKLVTVEDKSSLSPAEMLEKNNLANNDYSENPRVSRNRAFKHRGANATSWSCGRICLIIQLYKMSIYMI